MLNVGCEIDEIQATMLRSLASVHRLRIIHVLGTGSREVNEIVDELGMPQAAVSQHLGALRSAGIVEAVRDGRRVRYQLADPDVLTACSLMREVIVHRLMALGSLAAASVAAGRAQAPSSRSGSDPRVTNP